MFAKAFSYGGVLLLAGAAVLVTPALGQAQFRGVHFGGARFGGAFFGGNPGGFFRNPSPYGVPGGFYRNPGPYGYGYHAYYGYRHHAYYGGYPAYLAAYGGYGPYDYGGYGSYSTNYGPSYAQMSTDGSALNAPAKPALTAEEKDVRALVAATGVPTDDGHLVWPLALRLLHGQEAEALRGQIDALLQVAATQAARGQPNRAVVQELAEAADRFRKLLLRNRQERHALTQPAYEEAERFLDRLAGTPRLLQARLAPAPSGSGGEGKGGSDAPDHRP
jgi:hypothetical protein